MIEEEINWLAGLWRYEYRSCHSYAREALRDGENPWPIIDRFPEVRDAVVYALWPRLMESLTL